MYRYVSTQQQDLKRNAPCHHYHYISQSHKGTILTSHSVMKCLLALYSAAFQTQNKPHSMHRVVAAWQARRHEVLQCTMCVHMLPGSINMHVMYTANQQNNGRLLQFYCECVHVVYIISIAYFCSQWAELQMPLPRQPRNTSITTLDPAAYTTNALARSIRRSTSESTTYPLWPEHTRFSLFPYWNSNSTEPWLVCTGTTYCTHTSLGAVSDAGCRIISQRD